MPDLFLIWVGSAFVSGVFLGIFLGRLRHGYKNQEGGDSAGETFSSNKYQKREKIGESKINDLQKELSEAKILLENNRQENTEMSEIIESLDNALKRANGRLKLLLKSVNAKNPLD